MVAHHRWLAAAAVAIPSLAVALVSPASASSDGCAPGWGFDLGTKTECDNFALLAPGNDTRVNLLLLLLDRHGLPPRPPEPATRPSLDWGGFRSRFTVALAGNPADLPYGEGSRCKSNDGGVAAFEGAVKAAAGLTPDERAALVSARTALKHDCAPENDPAGTSPPAPAADGGLPRPGSAAGRDFGTYLRGTRAFYAGRFTDAEADFASLKGSADPWLADTAAYMVARTEVNGLQEDAFDAEGVPKGSDLIDKVAATRAEDSLEAYLKERPDGRYAGSARGLLRRVEWLAGWTEKLAARYAALLAKPASARDLDDVSLAEEIDNKLLPALTPQMTRDPILLAVMDLKDLRRGPSKPRAPAPGAAAARIDIEAQRDAFAEAPSLHAFLTAAAAFYRDGASAPVLAALPDDTRRRGGDYLWFSRQVLRGEALEAAGDRNARGFWKELRPGATRPLDGSVVELALALHDERHGDLTDVFAPGSPVTDPGMRTILLEHDAGPELLAARSRDEAAPVRERRIALFTLLYKQVTRGRYAEFLADVAGVPPDAPVAGTLSPEPDGDGPVALGLFAGSGSAGEIGCPTLPATAARLRQDPGSTRDRLCLAEFVRVNETELGRLDAPEATGQLGATPSTFPGQPFTRSAIYAAIMRDRAAPAEDRAYALYRAVRCYEPVGNNDCGGPDAPRAQRKGWYTELKRDYPASRWARKLSYWW